MFVHVSALERCGVRSLTEGRKVTFTTVVDKRKGKEAVDMIDEA